MFDFSQGNGEVTFFSDANNQFLVVVDFCAVIEFCVGTTKIPVEEIVPVQVTCRQMLSTVSTLRHQLSYWQK